MRFLTNRKRLILFLILLYSMLLFLSAIIVPILAKYGYYEQSAQINFLLGNSCHQNPMRSFWIFGFPLALCTRCLGFYFGCFLFCFVYLFNKFKISFLFVLFISAFVLTDLFLNIILSIDTGNIIRFFAGFCMSLVFVLIIQKIFYKGDKL